MRISDWSSDVCSSDLAIPYLARLRELGFAGWESAARDLLVQCRVVRKTNSTSFWRDTVAVEAWAGLEEKIADLVDYPCATTADYLEREVGRAAGRERGGQDGEISVVGVVLKNKKEQNTGGVG